ncbi:MAG: hypothetical protein ACRC7N_17860 [Clostridium sp.]
MGILQKDVTGSILTEKDYKEFLIFLYFGKNKDYMENCLNRAYRDFNIILHGFAKLKDKDKCYEEAKEYLRDRIIGLRSNKIKNQKEYDVWHEDTCNGLKDKFNFYEYNEFYIGQSQKWINMTLKYIFLHGKDRIPGLTYLYNFCHIPIDNIILKKLNFDFNVAWSKLNDYQVYIEFQKNIRDKNIIPLDFEFKLFME